MFWILPCGTYKWKQNYWQPCSSNFGVQLFLKLYRRKFQRKAGTALCCWLWSFQLVLSHHLTGSRSGSWCVERRPSQQELPTPDGAKSWSSDWWWWIQEGWDLGITGIKYLKFSMIVISTFYQHNNENNFNIGCWTYKWQMKPVQRWPWSFQPQHSLWQQTVSQGVNQ